MDPEAGSRCQIAAASLFCRAFERRVNEALSCRKEQLNMTPLLAVKSPPLRPGELLQAAGDKVNTVIAPGSRDITDT